MMPPTHRFPRRGLERRGGFTFIELIVALAIMSMIAAAVTPVLFSSLDRARVTTAVAALTGISDAIDAFEEHVKEHPGTLAQLVEPIATAQENICGNHYKTGQGKGGTAEWLGPYMDRAVPATGIPIGVGRAENQLEREGTSYKGGYLVVNVTGVTLDDVSALDLEVDGQDGRLGGSIRWAEPGAATTLTVQYYKPSPRC